MCVSDQGLAPGEGDGGREELQASSAIESLQNPSDKPGGLAQVFIPQGLKQAGLTGESLQGAALFKETMLSEGNIVSKIIPTTASPLTGLLGSEEWQYTPVEGGHGTEMDSEMPVTEAAHEEGVSGHDQSAGIYHPLAGAFADDPDFQNITHTMAENIPHEMPAHHMEHAEHTPHEHDERRQESGREF